MKHFLTGLLLLLQVVFGSVAFADAPVPPRPAPGPGIYVQDNAGVLSSQTRQQLLNIGGELEKKTKAQLAVLTVDSLDGYPVDTYALSVLRKWGIGSKDKNNGVLILVAVKDHKSRIEVGYGLEGALPDGLTGRIQDKFMLPYFKEGQYDAGIRNGYLVTAQLIAKEYGVKLTGDMRAAPVKRTNGGNSWATVPLVILLIILLIIDNIFWGGTLTRLLLIFFWRGGGRGGGGFGGGGFGGGSGGGGGSSRSW